MSIHRYPPPRLAGDYIRALLGISLTLGPVLIVRPGPTASILLGLIALLCFFFLARTIERHRTIVSMDENGIAVSAWFGGTIAWKDLERIQLAYYSLKKDRSQGWMQLTLKGRTVTVKLDSQIDGFLPIIERATQAARENGLSVNHITLTNLQALGVA